MKVELGKEYYSNKHNENVTLESVEGDLSEVKLKNGQIELMETKDLIYIDNNTTEIAGKEIGEYNLEREEYLLEIDNNYSNDLETIENDPGEEKEDLNKIEEVEPLEKGEDQEKENLEDLQKDEEEDIKNDCECCYYERQINEELVEALERYDKQKEIEMQQKCIGFATYMMAKYMSSISVSENDYKLWNEQFK